jgi:hypothetical protein
MMMMNKMTKTSQQAPGEAIMRVRKSIRDQPTGRLKRRNTMKAQETKKTFLILIQTDKKTRNVTSVTAIKETLEGMDISNSH